VASTPAPAGGPGATGPSGPARGALRRPPYARRAEGGKAAQRGGAVARWRGGVVRRDGDREMSGLVFEDEEAHAPGRGRPLGTDRPARHAHDTSCRDRREVGNGTHTTAAQVAVQQAHGRDADARRGPWRRTPRPRAAGGPGGRSGRRRRGDFHSVDQGSIIHRLPTSRAHVEGDRRRADRCRQLRHRQAGATADRAGGAHEAGRVMRAAHRLENQTGSHFLFRWHTSRPHMLPPPLTKLPARALETVSA